MHKTRLLLSTTTGGQIYGRVYATGLADRRSGCVSGNYIAERSSFEINNGLSVHK
jgi:hypothetical protein